MAKQKKPTEIETNPFIGIVKDLGNDYVSLVEDGLVYDSDFFIDTGSYIFNGLLSGSIFKGLPGSKITALAGAQATGKTYFLLEIIKNFLNANLTGYAFIFESEGAIGKDMLIQRGIDPKRVYVVPVATIEEFRTQAMKLLSGYLTMEESKRPKMLIALDSLGMLSSIKETEDTESGKDKKDMTKPGLIKGAFRVLTLKCARAKVPIVLTNHTYDVIGCLDGFQNIIMSDDGLKIISEISVGDRVKTLSGDGFVEEKFEYVASVFELELSNGQKIKCTKDHKFMDVQGNWKTVEELNDGDVILTL